MEDAALVLNFTNAQRVFIQNIWVKTFCG